jgi:hypothetical protein
MLKIRELTMGGVLNHWNARKAYECLACGKRVLGRWPIVACSADCHEKLPVGIGRESARECEATF